MISGIGGTRAACASKNTTASWLRARVGVLEDARGAAGGTGSTAWR